MTTMSNTAQSNTTISGATLLAIILTLYLGPPHQQAAAGESVDFGPRPLQLIDKLPAGELREQLDTCRQQTAQRSDFSISHRGAPRQIPEHTKEGYLAAAHMGAGIIECDVTFTQDKALVCRHSQCDLHTTTNILQTPLTEKCSIPPDTTSNTPYKNVKCCTSDITLTEFKSLRGKVDAGNKGASTVEEFMADSASTTGTLMTHAESIELFKSLGLKMIPELKKPQVDMPYQGVFSQQQFAQALIDEYIAAGVPANQVYLQSFSLEDIEYWLAHNPEFATQTTWLDGRYRDNHFNISAPESWTPSMQQLADKGLKILAPPLWMLLTVDDDNQIVPSEYANSANKAGLELITWSLERSGAMENGGGWYYQSIQSAIKNEGDTYAALDVLAQQVNVRGVFSDWPATVTYYANCTGLD